MTAPHSTRRADGRRLAASIAITVALAVAAIRALDAVWRRPAVDRTAHGYAVRRVHAGRHPDAILTGDAPVLPALRGVNGDRFATSPTCAWCHSNAPSATAMRDARGGKLAPDDQWRPSLHALSARDPIFRGALAHEAVRGPADRRAALEHACLGCHAPMLARFAEAALETASLSRLYAADEGGHLGRDGVSCAACHQIDAAGLGTPATFGGRFAVGNLRRMYGPHPDPDGRTMLGRVRFTPVHGAHVSDAAMCGTCHASGAGPAAAVATYLEWRRSSFDRERAQPAPTAASCQDCHMPRHDEAGESTPTRIARDMGGGDDHGLRPRPWIARHAAPGGNTLALALMRDHARELRPPADPDELDLSIGQLRAQLAGRTAAVDIAAVERTADALAFRVVVRSRVGHKLPTGTPIRRAWLRVRVGRPGAAPIFASGEVDAHGRILAQGVPLASEARGVLPEPHRDSIDSAGQVQIYEAVPGDESGAARDGLAAIHDRAGTTARWVKDNRLLPDGWSPSAPDAPAVAPVGTAADADFAAGGDTVHYRVALPAGSGPLAIEVELLYQPLTPRWATVLADGTTEEGIALRHYLEAADWTPVLLARAAAKAD